jgi:hypothetical protein
MCASCFTGVDKGFVAQGGVGSPEEFRIANRDFDWQRVGVALRSCKFRAGKTLM